MMSKFSSPFTKFPVLRGMAVYAVLWPSSDLCRQLATNRMQQDKTYATMYYLVSAFYCILFVKKIHTF